MPSSYDAILDVIPYWTKEARIRLLEKLYEKCPYEYELAMLTPSLRRFYQSGPREVKK